MLLIENGDVLQFDEHGGAHRRQGARRAACSSTARGPARSATKCCAIAVISPKTAWSCRSSRSTSRPGRSKACPTSSRAGSSWRTARRCSPTARACSSRRRRTVERRGAHRSGAHQGEAARRAAPLLPQALGPPAVRAARHHGDLTREWIRPCRVASASSSASRCSPPRSSGSSRSRATSRPIPSWFFSTGAHARAGRTSPAASARFSPSSRFSCSATPSYLIPLVMVDRRLALLLVPQARRRRHESRQARCCSSAASARFSASSSARSRSPANRSAPAATSATGLARELSEYLNRTGSMIVVVTLIVLAVILSTQFSFGRMLAAIDRSSDAIGRPLTSGCREWWEDAPPREAARATSSRRHARRRAPDAEPPQAADEGDRDECRRRRRRIDARRGRCRRPRRSRRSRAPPHRRAGQTAKGQAAARRPTLPLADAEPTPRRRPSARRATTRCRRSRCSTRSKTERKIDERELMDGARLLEEKCREFSVEGSVVQIHPGPVVTTFEFKPDAGVKYSQDHRPLRRPVSRDAGRVRPHRSHPRQIDRRHPDPESRTARHLAARAARVRGVSRVDLEAHDRARQDDPRRAVRHRSRDDAPPADCRLDRRRQVGRHERHAHQHPLPLDARRCAADHDRSRSASSSGCTRTSRTC